MTKIIIIFNIFAFLIILRTLYRVSHYGKIIININKNRFWAIISLILWVGTSILWCRLGYLNYTQSGYIFDILLSIAWIEISISNIIRTWESSGLRENGINCFGNFYEWSKVQSYSWISPDTIQFKVNTFFIHNYNFEFTIKEELKSKVNETVQKYVF